MAMVGRIGKISFNAYVLTCDFGTQPITRFGYLDAEFLFLDMMNQVRMVPLQTLERYGIDMKLLSNLHPAVVEILTNRLPPVVYSPSLRDVALKRDEAAIANPSAEENPLSVLHYDNCTESGVGCPALTGEVVVTYKDSQNLLPPEVVQVLFKELLIRELQSTDISQLWILNPNVQEIGMILGLRQITAIGSAGNYYVLANAYGRDYRSKLEKQSLNLLNQARTVYTPPLPGPDSEIASDAWKPIPPLVHNHMVYASADAHAHDMIKTGYFDTYSYDGIGDCGDRLEEIGVSVSEADETIKMVTSEMPFDPEAIGVTLFDNLLAAPIQLDPLDQGPLGLLSPRMKTAGVRFLYSTPVTPGSIPEETISSFQRFYSLLLVADVAVPSESTEVTLVGLIFEDKNVDGSYDRDEELAFMPVIIRNGETAHRFYTDAAGNVTVPLAAGTYEVEVEYDGILISQTVEIGSDNTLLLFSF